MNVRMRARRNTCAHTHTHPHRHMHRHVTLIHTYTPTCLTSYVHVHALHAAHSSTSQPDDLTRHLVALHGTTSQPVTQTCANTHTHIQTNKQTTNKQTDMPPVHATPTAMKHNTCMDTSHHTSMLRAAFPAPILNASGSFSK